MTAQRSVKITDVRVVLLTGPCTNDPFLTECRRRRSAAFIEVLTNTDLVGLGETYAGYFCPELVPGVVDFFRPILVDQSVEDIGELWNRMYHCENFWCRVGLGAIVLTGIEAALWDLKGKILQMPVYELLGGRKHEKLECYATGGPSNYPLDKLAAKMDYYLSLGFKGFKLGVGSHSAEGGDFLLSAPNEAADFEAAKMAFVRAHVGSEARIMLDCHMGNNPVGNWDLATAAAVAKALEPYDLLFLEEPLHYKNPWDYAELRKRTRLPIAGGECLTTSYEWRLFIEGGCIDIGQPDASFIGGLGEFVNVASMLDGHGLRLATHSWGAAGSLMQNIHAGFACANTMILEVPPGYGPLHSEILQDSFIMERGYVFPPDKPGLGIVLTDSIKKSFPFIPGSGEFNSVEGKTLID
jgi:L-alanine-DL-glutamate epimerase-like enolase superfamily enzyme